MARDEAQQKLSLAIFASEKGPGDAERASILAQSGNFFARKGARLIYPVCKDGISAAMVKSARAAGGDVLFLAGPDFRPPKAFSDAKIEHLESREAYYRRLDALTDAYVGLPGSLSSVSTLYSAWLETGGQKPVALLNRNRSFELMRGFAADILNPGKPDWEKSLAVSESLDELWARITRMVNG